MTENSNSEEISQGFQLYQSSEMYFQYKNFFMSPADHHLSAMVQEVKAEQEIMKSIVDGVKKAQDGTHSEHVILNETQGDISWDQ